MSELLFRTFYVFVKLMIEVVLSLAGGGRRNRTLCCSFIGPLNYLFPWGQSNWENCMSGCINSLLQFHFNPLKSHQSSVHWTSRTPRIVSEQVHLYSQGRGAGWGVRGHGMITHDINCCVISDSKGAFLMGQVSSAPGLTDYIQIWHPAQWHRVPLLKHLISQGRKLVQDTCWTANPTHLRFHRDHNVTQIKILEEIFILGCAQTDDLSRWLSVCWIFNWNLFRWMEVNNCQQSWQEQHRLVWFTGTALWLAAQRPIWLPWLIYV